MAEDKETGLIISVSAEADEKSAKVAANKIAENVLRSLKDGQIKIPTTVEAEFDKKKASPKLIQAQKAFLEQWKEMSSKGFSSSKEELDDLVKKYDEFKRLINNNGKNNTKQKKALASSGLGTMLQSYKKELTKIQTDTKTTPSRRKVGVRTNISDEEIRADIERRQKRKLSGVASITKFMDYKTRSGVNPSNTNDYAVRASEYNPYRNTWMTQQKLSEIKAKKELRATYRSWVDKDYTDEYVVKNASKTSEKDQWKALSEKAFGELSSMVSKAQAGKLEDVFDTLSDQVKVTTVLLYKSRKRYGRSI